MSIMIKTLYTAENGNTHAHTKIQSCVKGKLRMEVENVHSSLVNIFCWYNQPF